MMRHISYIFIFILLVVIVGCSPKGIQFSSLKPISPVGGIYRIKAVQVSSPKVLLEWEKAKEPDAKYDVIIFDAIIGEHFSRGEQIYYRENIDSNKHLVDYNFVDNTMYFWSVRKRINSKPDIWSSYYMGYDETSDIFSFCYHCSHFFQQLNGRGPER
ncbi:MAG TPA: hypothetical protein VF828_04330 [Patescibacteria group bacterium]